MANVVKKLIGYSFLCLGFIAPLIFYSKTSELFEFNKLVFVYAISIFIAGLWVMRMIIERKIVVSRTVLGPFILLFILSLIISTSSSIDSHVSIWGYPGRWNGGLLSIITYSFLYFAYVSNMAKKQTKNFILSLIASATLISIIGILEHFGKNITCIFALGFAQGFYSVLPNFSDYLNTNCWHQSVDVRVFSTLGQPNWLAAFLVAIIPISLSMALINKAWKKYVYLSSGILMFTALLFTGSKSGGIAFAISTGLFAILTLIKSKDSKKIKSSLTTLAIFILGSLAIFTSTKIPSTINISESTIRTTGETPSQQVNITDSGDLRLLVWETAIDISKVYPMWGSGPETFAYMFPVYKPVEHNLTSEWDFLYNKAHNEYLNYLATTGIVTTTVYLLMVLVAILSFFTLVFGRVRVVDALFGKQGPKSGATTVWKPNSITAKENTIISIAILSGYISILITNFFGFSVVTTSLLFFLFPAIAVSLNNKHKLKKEKKIGTFQYILVAMTALLMVILFNVVRNYWTADNLYAKAKSDLSKGNNYLAREKLNDAVLLNPNEAGYWSELATTSANLAVIEYNKGDQEVAELLSSSSTFESERAIKLSPGVSHLKQKAINQITLSALDLSKLDDAVITLEKAVETAPNDPKIMYNLGLAYLRTDDRKSAKSTFEKTVEIKSNYADARYALALMLIDDGDLVGARDELQTILTEIDPNYIRAQAKLEEIN